MKKLLLLITLLGLLAISGFSQTANYWSASNASRSNIVADQATNRQSFPKEVKLFTLNAAPLRQALFAVVTPPQSSGRSAIISLPNAAGSVEDFEVYEASNFEAALQARFPEIRSFSGRGITDKAATLKLSISPQGIQTMVFRTGKDNEFIEPYSKDHTVYAVFASQRAKGSLPWTCTTVDQQLATNLTQQVGSSGITARSGGDLKTMRLAQSVTAEYSNYFGATSASQVGLVLAGINATLTRCNGVYEKDLALHLNLVAASTNVIYYNPATDPYSPGPTGAGGAWNNELQTTLTSVIGEANYDIGHLFGASGGGGNAGCIGCICVNGSKGRGFTSPADAIPQGDNFDIDYVAHEIGHQLGGNHTFSFSNEGTGVNKEVGSGITIMGYAGITNQDVAPHSIDIFHQASIAQIQTNLAGKTCPVTTTITNATPVVAPVSNYTIPRSTPFALTGAATDANATDVLTYCWEQNDNALSSQTGANSVASPTKLTGPNWLSFSPTTSPTRFFPRLATILTGGQVTGPLPGGDAGANIEALSSVARTLNFRLTVRDNAPYSSTAPVSVGQTSFTDMAVTVNAASGPFVVTAPNTPVTWTGGSSQTITWDVAGTNVIPVNCANVKISLSTDGGQTFPTVLAASTQNDGTEVLTIPNTTSTTARIKVEAVGNIFFDISNTNFTISNTIQPALLAAGSTTITAQSCTPGNGIIDPGETVTVSFCIQNNGGTATTTNLTGTLQNTGGVSNASAAQNYGAVPTGGSQVCRSFSFTANGTCGSTITASINFQDGATNLGTVTYTFTLGVFTPNPVVATTNSAAIAIPLSGAATPYPSNITVSGITNPVSKVTVQLNNLSHTYPDDILMLLVSPTGQKVALMTRAGGLTPIVNANLIFDDAAASSVPDEDPIPSNATTTYKPTDLGGDLPAPAPARPYITTLSSLNGLNPNGTWSLYVADELQPDAGSIAGGWTLNITTSTAICCVPPPNLTITDVTQAEGNSGTSAFTFTVNLSAPAPAGGVSFTATTANGTATAGSDYVALNTSGSIAAGSSSTNVVVTVNGDVIVEANETFFVNITSPTNAVITDGQGLGTITNDDANPCTTDNQPPSITLKPSPTVFLNAANTYTVQLSDVLQSVSDNCDPNPSASVSTLQVNCSNLGSGGDPTPHQPFIATNSTGNQNFRGEFGMDFRVNAANGIVITQLGAFDHQSNGITGTQSGGIRVAIFNKATQTIVAGLDAVITGNGDVFAGNYRYRNIPAVTLPPGDYLIIAKGYNASELLGNSFEGGGTPPQGDNGGGAISYLNSAFYDDDDVAGFNYPANSLNTGTSNIYKGATFTYALDGSNMVTITATDVSGNQSQVNATVTVVDTFYVLTTKDITVNLNSSGQATIQPADVLQSLKNNCGIDVTSSTLQVSPSSFNCSNTGGSPHQPFIATNSTGNQNFGGEFGMDFRVNAASGIVIDQLGAFDHQANGITGTQSGGIRVAIFNKATQTIVPGLDAVITGNGDAFAGNYRYKNIPAVTLLPGDYLIIAKGYNAGELLGNSVEGGGPYPQGDNAGGAISYLNYAFYDDDNVTGFNYPVNSLNTGISNIFKGATFVYKTFSTVVTLTATDVYGNQKQATANVTVVDNSGPVIATKNITVALNAAGNASIVPGDVLQSPITDNCGVNTGSISVSPNNFSCADYSTSGAPHQPFIATNSTGNQNFRGEFGMDFRVNSSNGIVINQLGAFDHQANGITGTQSGGIRVAIFNKATQAIVPGLDAVITGNGDAFAGNYRYRNIPAVTLPQGDYLIIAKGYNASELLGNSVEGGGPYPQGDNAGGAISYLNTAFYGADNPAGFSYPDNSLNTGTSNIYKGATFTYALDGSNNQVVTVSATDVNGNVSQQTAVVTITDPTNACSSPPVMTYAAKDQKTDVPVILDPVTMSVKVYPNPSTGQFTVQLLNVKAPKVTLQIMDANGQVIEQRTVTATGKTPSLNIPVDISKHASGIYLIKLISADGVQSAKVVVSR